MRITKLIGVAAVLLVAGAQARGAGFEKSVMWSGREAGYAAAGMSRVNGSQALVFNPAGLAAGSSEASLNFSPTFIDLNGSIVSSSVREESDHNFSPIGGGLLSYRVNDRLGVGVGAYVSGGSKAIYDSVNFASTYPSVTLSPRIATDLKIMEYAIGAGYELAPGWRVGLAWRIVHAWGGFSTAKYLTVANGISYTNIYEAKQTRYNGFRLGVQYEAPEGQWGVGAAFRNTININATGKINGATQLVNGTNVASTFSPEVTLGTSFPWEASLGGHYSLGDFLLMGDVDFVKYSNNQQLAITGTLNGNALPNIALNWKDMWNFRVGTEYSGLQSVKLRFGYALTTQVTSTSDARATLTPPGTGHLFTVGAGTSLWKNFDLDGAFEYAFNSADGSMTAGTTGSGTSVSREFLAGTTTKFKVKSIGIHTGVTYRF